MLVSGGQGLGWGKALNAPNRRLCSRATLVASDHLVAPLQPEDYGGQGLGPVQESVDLVVSGPDPRPHLLGSSLTTWNARLAIHTLYDTLLREQYGEAVFEPRIPYAADDKEAIARRRPIAQYKPRGASGRSDPPRPCTFRLADGNVTLEPKKIGGPEALLAMVEEVADALSTGLGARAHERERRGEAEAA